MKDKTLSDKWFWSNSMDFQAFHKAIHVFKEKDVKDFIQKLDIAICTIRNKKDYEFMRDQLHKLAGPALIYNSQGKTFINKTQHIEKKGSDNQGCTKSKGCNKVQVNCICDEYIHWCGDRCVCGHINLCDGCDNQNCTNKLEGGKSR